jgi:RHS repeat-associated protein
MTTPKLRLLVGCIVCTGLLFFYGSVNSQTSNGDPPDNDIGGNDSPAGVSGGFNGMVNTACAYDPYTGNAQRAIDDIVVPGAVGAYGLRWTRFYNSRDADIDTGLGPGWRHSYLWQVDYQGTNAVRFPDGREIDFYEASGIPERFPNSNQLLLGDGGQVIFELVPYQTPEGQYYKFQVTRIIDPYGLATVMGYEVKGTDDNGNTLYRLATITEPAGRYLKLIYSTPDPELISGVQAYDANGILTQSVTYTYTSSTYSGSATLHSMLGRVDYSDGTAAEYTYQNDNSSRNGSPGIPLLKTCDDPRYYGPMHQIDYLFVQGDRIRGKIKSERKFGSNQAVSTLTFPSGRDAMQKRIETRGDGFNRTFTYSSTGRLFTSTDFKTPPLIVNTLGYDANNFLRSTKDALDHETIYTRESNIGQTTQVLRADGVSHVDLGYSDVNNPYYLTSRTDERDHTTYFDRDGNNRIWQIRYPDGAIEKFWYTPDGFGQVRTHQRRNNAYEHFDYYPDGSLKTVWNPTSSPAYPPAGDVPYVSLYYYDSGHVWAGRVSEVLDQAWHGTIFEYDVNSAGQPVPGRGLVTKITHTADGSYVSFGYDAVGNLLWREDELRKRTSFAYDDYSRIKTVTPPAPAGPITFTYERAGAADPYLHTAQAAHIATNGAGVTVERVYDQNFRLKNIIQVDGTDSPPTTSVDYWENGLLKAVHDPRNPNWMTSYTYTARNQQETVTDALNHRTFTHYDLAGNVDYIDRPDNRRVLLQNYDEMNRVRTVTEPLNDSANKVTAFTYWPSGRTKTVEDNNHQVTTFYYDHFDRQQNMYYPDGTFQHWDYDAVGILREHQTVGGKKQHFQPDTRNRISDTWWDPGDPSENAHFVYDAANRLIQATNPNGIITRQYDDAGRVLSEEQNVYGLGAKTMTYGSDGAGKRTTMGVAGTDYQFAYQYDTLGRLEQILNVDNAPGGATQSLWYQYSYDAASNQTQRYCPMNGVAQNYTRDALGRLGTLKIEQATQPKYSDPEPPPIGAAGSDPVVPVPALPRPLSILVGLTNLTSTVGDTVQPVGTVISKEDYGYNDLSQVTLVQRMNGQNDSFSYDYSGQLTGASYVGWYQGTGIRYVNYTQDALGNRSQVVDNGTAQGYSPVPTYLNEYASGPAGGINNSTEHQIAGYEGLSYAYRNDGKLSSVSGNGNSYYAAYDAFGRCVKRTLNGNTIYYTYDGPHSIYEWKADGSRAGWNVYGQGIDEILLRADYVSDPNGNGQGFFYQQNGQGSVIHLTNFSGQPIESYRYDAFGTPITTYHAPGAFDNRFKFTGREYQPAFGIYEYRNRAYHPGLGRFLSEDPMGFAAGDSNMFRYCGGDPVNSTDPFGLADDRDQRKPPPTKKKDGRDDGDNTLLGDGIYEGTTGTLGGGDNTLVYFDGTTVFNGVTNVSAGGGPVIGPWGERSTDGASNFGSNDHGSGSSGRDGGGGGSSPLNTATLLKINFYTRYGSAFENALRSRAGYVLDIPPQNLANSPELILGYSERDLMRKTGSFFPTGVNQPDQGPYGTIYIANEAFRDRNLLQPYRTYAHELANIVDQRIYQSSPYDPLLERHFGDRKSRDNDSGNAVELALFGPEW